VKNVFHHQNDSSKRLTDGNPSHASDIVTSIPDTSSSILNVRVSSLAEHAVGEPDVRALREVVNAGATEYHPAIETTAYDRVTFA